MFYVNQVLRQVQSRVFKRKLVLSLSLILTAHVFAGGAEYLSPIGVAAAADGAMIYIAQATGKQIDYFDTATEKVVKTIAVSDKLSGIAVSSNGEKLYATAGDFDGKVFVVDVKKGRVGETIAVGHSPIAPVLSVDGKTLYVCQKFNDNVAVIDLASRKVIAEIPVIRSPFAAAITPDGSKLYVGIISQPGAIDVIDTAQLENVKTIDVPGGIHNIYVTPDGKTSLPVPLPGAA